VDDRDFPCYRMSEVLRSGLLSSEVPRLTSTYLQRAALGSVLLKYRGCCFGAVCLYIYVITSQFLHFYTQAASPHHRPPLNVSISSISLAAVAVSTSGASFPIITESSTRIANPLNLSGQRSSSGT
jgi:hypothetical protein